jgi:hypothetical protein
MLASLSGGASKQEQFLAQVNNVGITDIHKVKLFPLSLSGTYCFLLVYVVVTGFGRHMARLRAEIQRLFL